MKTPSHFGSRGILRKLAIYGFVALVACYILSVASGYCWLRFVRKNDQIALTDVAFFRMVRIRRGIAVQHFSNAQSEWDAKNFQSAYLFFTAGVRQDPDNISGRLTAARFLRSVGGGNLALIMLEEGLTRAPEERRLIEPTFDLLLSSGRDRLALELLKRIYGTDHSGQNSVLLQRYEVEATLAEDPAAARKLLEKYPALLQDPLAARTAARVLWETRERLKAIDILQQYLKTQPGTSADYVLLAGWQETAGQVTDAVQTARRSTEKFPSEISAQVLLIEMLSAENPAGPAVPRAIAEFLRSFGNRPGAVPELAVLAGRKGWVDLSRSLYGVAANSLRDLSVLGLSYCDALVRVARFADARGILTELDAQTTDGSTAFMIQLRQRQVIVCAAQGDSDNVREYARRLAAMLSQDHDGLDACRRLFRKIGIPDAVAELSSRSLTTAALAKK